MSSSSLRACCPHCGVHAPHAFLSATSTSVVDNENVERNFGLTADQRLICTACEQSWEAAIVPQPQLRQLHEAVAGLDEAKRHIAMLRLIMSKEQIERAESSQQDIIPLRRAA